MSLYPIFEYQIYIAEAILELIKSAILNLKLVYSTNRKILVDCFPQSHFLVNMLSIEWC